MSEGRLSRRSVFGYGLGDAGNNLVFATGLLFLLPYYTDVAGLGAAAAGAVILGVRLYDAVVELLIGHFIDRRTEDSVVASGAGNYPGRFRPWLRWGALPLLLNLAVFSVPGDWPQPARVAYAAISYALLGTAYALVNIPYGSLASVMTQQARERARLGASRTLASTLTFLAVAATLGPMLRAAPAGSVQTRLSLCLLAFACIGLLCFAACRAWTHELPLPRKPAPAWGDALATLRANRPLQVLSLATLCTLAGSAANSAAALYYARHVIGGADYFLPMMLATTLAGVLIAVPLTPTLAGLLGKRRCFQLGMTLASLAHVALYFLRTLSPWGAIAVLAAGAVGVSIGMASLWALEADTVEHGARRSGLRLEGLNYALFSLVRKIGLALGGALPAFLLAGSDYAAGMATQSEAVRALIRLSITLVPASAFVLALALMLRYPSVEPAAA